MRKRRLQRRRICAFCVSERSGKRFLALGCFSSAGVTRGSDEGSPALSETHYVGVLEAVSISTSTRAELNGAVGTLAHLWRFVQVYSVSIPIRRVKPQYDENEFVLPEGITYELVEEKGEPMPDFRCSDLCTRLAGL